MVDFCGMSTSNCKVVMMNIKIVATRGGGTFGFRV
jgi:hypothetical protein